MWTVQRLRVVEWGSGIHRVWRNNQSQVLPVVEVRRTVGPYAPCPDVRSQLGMLLVFAVPVVGAVLLKDLESVGVNGIAVGVQPTLSWTDAVVALRQAV